MDESTTEKIIDWATVMNVCGYESLVETIIKSGLKDARQALKLLAKAIKAANSADVALYAHRLKGVGMTMGATGLSEKAYRLECAGDEKDIETAASLLGDVEDEFEKVTTFLSESDWIEAARQQQENRQTEQLETK
ncbi:MAG: Hpt domain-containing protein [Planctomycetes bacterium]|nr:Hpt domain-containing protein [Planctomycetota bacterium]